MDNEPCLTNGYNGTCYDCPNKDECLEGFEHEEQIIRNQTDTAYINDVRFGS